MMFVRPAARFSWTEDFLSTLFRRATEDGLNNSFIRSKVKYLQCPASRRQ